MDKETLIIAWLALLLAPLVLYGIWMRIKMMGSEEGQAFLQDSELARYDAERENWHRGEEYEESAGKIASLNVGIDAAKGKYGNEVASTVPKAVKFFLGYTLYAAIIGIAGYFLFL